VLGDYPSDWHQRPGAGTHISSLNDQRREPGRRYDAYRATSTVPLWSWRPNWRLEANGEERIAEAIRDGIEDPR
jgi:hypothetical protein